MQAKGDAEVHCTVSGSSNEGCRNM